MFKGLKIVAIDGTPSIITFLRLSLEGERVEFYNAANAKKGLDLCKQVLPDLVILDLGLPDMDGLEILPEIKKIRENNAPKVLVLTVRKGRQVVSDAFKNGADAYLAKPFIVDDLVETISDVTK
ncbi:response regulator [Rickettsiales bacterium]|nr:response regulator [Rickettsiales bacterium]